MTFLNCEGCSEKVYGKVPDLFFSMGGHEFKLPKSSFLKQDGIAVDNCRLMLASSDMDTSGSQAASGAFFGDSGSTNWLLGDMFL